MIAHAPVDFVIVDHGRLWLLWPLSISAGDFLQETAPKEDVMFFHSALAVEPRYVHGVLQAITEEGFEVGYQARRVGQRVVEACPFDLDSPPPGPGN